MQKLLKLLFVVFISFLSSPSYAEWTLDLEEIGSGRSIIDCWGVGDSPTRKSPPYPFPFTGEGLGTYKDGKEPSLLAILKKREMLKKQRSLRIAYRKNGVKQ